MQYQILPSNIQGNVYQLEGRINNQISDKSQQLTFV